jgi:hypothetical protein
MKSFFRVLDERISVGDVVKWKNQEKNKCERGQILSIDFDSESVEILEDESCEFVNCSFDDIEGLYKEGE